MDNLTQNIQEAYQRIAPHVVETPLLPSAFLSEASGACVFLKCEGMQLTGSFKIRGALNKMLLAPQNSLEVIAASSGNHGKGVAYAAQKLQRHSIIYLPSSVGLSKKKAIEALGAQTIVVEGDCLVAETTARAIAERENKLFISPYNDCQVIAGQGTIGVELEKQMKSSGALDAVFIAVGGGGLISGISQYIKSFAPQTEIVGCWPANSPAMYEAMQAGHIHDVPEEPTLSDGTAGPIEEGTVTFALCQKLIDTCVLVSENEIAHALAMMVAQENIIVEGAAAVAVAAFLKERNRYCNKNVGIVLCGRNIEFTTLQEILSRVR